MKTWFLPKIYMNVEICVILRFNNIIQHNNLMMNKSNHESDSKSITYDLSTAFNVDNSEIVSDLS